MWYLVYVATVVASYAQLGLMTTGPFDTIEQCSQYAHATWNEKNTFNEVELDRPNTNWFHSNHKITYMESKTAQMGVYWSCVNPRNPKDTRYSIIENNMGGDGNG